MSILSAKLNKKQIVKVYSGKASVYDGWGYLTETNARVRSLALANITDGETILEVAVGTGLTFREILHANPHGTNYGVDLTPAMLEKAKAKAAKTGATNYTLSVGDAYKLNFSDHRFDLLVNNYMFDLLPEEDFGKVLQEFKRVLKPGGRIVLVNMTPGEKFPQTFWDTVYRIQPSWMGGCRGVLLEEPMRAAGFKNIHRERLSQFSFPSEILTATV